MSKTPPKKTSPTTRPAESVLTRYKSAQQGRQLRKKDRSMKSITQLLKSPSQKSTSTGELQRNSEKDKKSISGKKTPSVPRNSLLKKKVADDSKELLPNILKKSVSQKKITLKPKYEMTVVARTNKRKLNTPHRGLLPSPTRSYTDIVDRSGDAEIRKSNKFESFGSEMTMSDIVRLAEETDSLDDDDFMEILTCPSPVWWEDPPDDSYVEEPIYVRIPTKVTKKDQSLMVGYNDKKGNIKRGHNTYDIVVKTNDKRIIEKRNKLEKILGKIKHKFDEHNNSEMSDTGSASDKEINRCGEEIKEGKKEEVSESGRRDLDIIDNESKCIDSKPSRIDKELNMVTINSKGNNYDVLLSDISDNGEELLRELENMDIPIWSDVKTDDNKASTSKLKDDKINTSIVKVKLIDKCDHNNTEAKSNDNDSEATESMPRGEKFPMQKFITESPKSSRSTSEDAATFSDDDNGSNSNSNIQYLNEDENGAAKANLNSIPSDKGDSNEEFQVSKVENKEKMETVTAVKESIDDVESYIDKSDFITVYKIMKNEGNEINEDSSNSSTVSKEHNDREEIVTEDKSIDKKLTATGKKRDNTSCVPMKHVKIRKIETKAPICVKCKRAASYMSIPDSNKKLCLRCSSIYEESCTVCAKSDNGETISCTCKVNIKTTKTTYSCNKCEFIANSLLLVHRHVKKCYSNETDPRTLNKLFTVIKKEL